MPLEMEFVRFLGKGSYGSVDLFGYRENDGSMFYNAVKISDSKRRDALVRESRILTELRGCPRIVQLLEKALLEEINSDGNRVYKMHMEYASGGTLTDFIRRNKSPLSDSIIREFTRMILQGLVSVHSHGYVHCDLKPSNLLLFPRYDEQTMDCSYELKISDFGLSTKAGGDSYCWEIDYPFVGTPVYMSSESVDDGTVERSLDLWSLGCIVLEMYTGKYPWLGVSLDDLQGILVEGLLGEDNAPKIPETVPLDARQFLEKCFARMPQDRGSASELLLHPFLIGDDPKTAVVPAGGERRLMGSRIRKLEDIPKNSSKLKTVSVRPSQFKRVLKKPVKVKKTFQVFPRTLVC
ncbi:unnamed protein product [Thlaspi arvense]|uniref:Protein kinase domain-containing protein n=1 Tax=Thlaspi arvense TaxID=13288 RepID=A0AAU9SCG0_THLAR|nr:unnamed protein product [Thlaspi arvense]